MIQVSQFVNNSQVCRKLTKSRRKKKRIFYGQADRKPEAQKWQLSARKNSPDELRKSFSREKKCVNHVRDKKV